MIILSLQSEEEIRVPVLLFGVDIYASDQYYPNSNEQDDGCWSTLFVPWMWKTMLYGMFMVKQLKKTVSAQ